MPEKSPAGLVPAEPGIGADGGPLPGKLVFVLRRRICADYSGFLRHGKKLMAYPCPSGHMLYQQA